jgi:hypothetical protein
MRNIVSIRKKEALLLKAVQLDGAEQKAWCKAISRTKGKSSQSIQLVHV